MQKRRVREGVVLALFAVVVTVTGARPVFAEDYSSNNYQLSETSFNAGASLNTCSAGYCARVSIGDSTIGNSNSPGATSATFGSVTPDRPTLDVIVEPGTSNLGVLTTETTGTKSMVVRVRSYLSDGYIMQLNGSPPKYGNYTLKTPATPTASTPGTEQFAINVVANTTPNVGANPVQVPDAQNSFGTVDNDYDNTNLFMYASGDTIASSSKASGETVFTLSMIVNIANNTPAGNFQGDYSIIVIPLY